MDEYIRITIVKAVVTKCSQKTSRSAGTLKNNSVSTVYPFRSRFHFD